MRMVFCRPLALSAVSLLALFGLSSVSAPAGASTSPSPAGVSIAASVAAKSPATASITPPAPPPLPSGTKQACAAPTRIGQEACMLFLHGAATRSGAAPALAPVSGAYAPADLQAAYNLTAASSADGTGETVAIVDAYADPDLAGDLATYRSQYGLPACTTSSGCLTVLNENGGTTLPTATDSTGGWEAEQAADVEMVSAICPNCKIVMVEANSTSITDLGNAENTAASHAKFVSNSWGGFDYPGDSIYDLGYSNQPGYFNHPGVAITFAAGDLGYGPTYPASSQLVTSVGGTYLTADPNDPSNPRGWTETVWNDQPASVVGATQSGCSAGEAKPSWQTDTGCANRTQNDVSAVASGPDGVSIYDSFDNCAGDPTGDWCSGYGTSIAAPIIAAVSALAGTPTPGTYPSSYLYESGHAADLNPVTTGSDGTCESNRLYLCNAADPLSNGYNGPVGWGTPNGITAFENSLTTNIVSAYNPGLLDIESGITYSSIEQLSAVDSGGLALTYSQSGLPAGLSMSASGFISGKTTAVGTHTVKVTATDSSGASSTVSFITAVAPSLDSAYHPGTGPVKLDWDSKCMDDTGNSSNNGTKIQIWTCNGGAAQNWAYYPDTDPGDAGEIVIHSKCLDIVNRGTGNGAKLQLYACNGGANQQWYIAGSEGELVNPVSGKCIDDPSNSKVNGKQLDIWTCNDEPWQAWTLPASPMLSGIAGKCMDDTNGSTANGNKIQLYACNGLATQKWTIGLDGTIRFSGKCLDATGRGTQDGTKMQLYACNGGANQEWTIGAFGMLENVNAEKCLADPSNSATNGTQLVLEDCYGDQGEIWAAS
jgi:ricin-type beta-trefoil lectin protein/putative Ig domain-containing protein